MSIEEMHDIELLHELHEVWEVVKQNNGDPVSRLARHYFGEVLAECARRELEFMSCLQ